VEFARISEDGRLTLVIHPGSAEQQTYWALGECENVKLAIEKRIRSCIFVNLGVRSRLGQNSTFVMRPPGFKRNFATFFEMSLTGQPMNCQEFCLPSVGLSHQRGK
jgi:hypothetical protein